MADTLKRPSDDRLGGNCGVTAVAVMAGVSFREAWTACAKARRARGRRVTRRWGGGTTWEDRRLAMDALGAPLVNLVPANGRRCSLANWVRLHALPGVTYMVRTGSHVQIVRDGMVLDQSTPEAVPISQFWGRRKLVSMASHAARG